MLENHLLWFMNDRTNLTFEVTILFWSSHLRMLTSIRRLYFWLSLRLFLIIEFYQNCSISKNQTLDFCHINSCDHKWIQGTSSLYWWLQCLNDHLVRLQSKLESVNCNNLLLAIFVDRSLVFSQVLWALKLHGKK